MLRLKSRFGRGGGWTGENKWSSSSADVDLLNSSSSLVIPAAAPLSSSL